MSPAELSPVSSVSVDYTCTSQSATVRWSAVYGADSYKATAMGENGMQLTCTSQGTSCRLTGLSCGQNYVVNVTPISENCRNMMNNTSATFQTGETKLLSQRKTTKKEKKRDHKILQMEQEGKLKIFVTSWGMFLSLRQSWETNHMQQRLGYSERSSRFHIFHIIK